MDLLKYHKALQVQRLQMRAGFPREEEYRAAKQRVLDGTDTLPWRTARWSSWSS
jgi:hypothetical protein